MGEEIFDRLRGCFIAGYTVPQFCIDEGIKKPLFVAEKVSESFIKELHLQFKCDKRILPQFCFIDSDTEGITLSIDYAPLISSKVAVTDISKVKFNAFDGIFLLTKKNYDIDFKRVICFTDFEDTFYRRTYVDIPLLNFLQRYPKVKLFLINFPGLAHFKGGKEFNSQLWDYGELRRSLAKNIQENVNMNTPFDNLGYTNSQVASLLKGTRVITHPDGSTTLSDDNDPLIRVQDGKRLTAYQPEEYLNKIYIVGTCHYYGTNAPFDKTIASYLQKMLNEANLPYRVENEGQCYWSRHQDMFYNLNKLSPVPGDIIFISISGPGMRSTNNNIPFFDVSDAFDPPHDFKEIYCRKGHVNELGYKILAEKYLNFLTENNFFKDHEINYPPPPVNLTSIAMAYLRNSSRAA